MNQEKSGNPGRLNWMSPIDQILLKISVSLSSKHAGMGFL
jgi:hypothetical protein